LNRQAIMPPAVDGKAVPPSNPNGARKENFPASVLEHLPGPVDRILQAPLPRLRDNDRTGPGIFVDFGG